MERLSTYETHMLITAVFPYAKTQWRAEHGEKQITIDEACSTQYPPERSS